VIIEFEKDYLRELYEEGKTKSKKYRFQPSEINQYKKAIDILRAVICVEDLYVFKSLNYEKLSGDKRGIESVRLNIQYRIEFTSKTTDYEPKKLTICSIIRISNHYK